MLARYGVPELLQTKAEVRDALANGIDPADIPEPTTRDQRAAAKVAIAQSGHFAPQGEPDGSLREGRAIKPTLSIRQFLSHSCGRLRSG